MIDVRERNVQVDAIGQGFPVEAIQARFPAIAPSGHCSAR